MPQLQATINMSQETYDDFAAASNGVPLSERVLRLIRDDVKTYRFNALRPTEAQLNAVRSEVDSEVTLA